jgi:hypothetical protein
MPLRALAVPAVLLAALIGVGELWIVREVRDADLRAMKSREAIWLQRVRQIETRTAPADVVFLGDSTVESAIDDALFGSQTGLAALNLGLTGDLGTYGDYAVLSRYLERFPAPRAVVVWHAIDVWGRDLDPQLFAFTHPGPRDTLRGMGNVLRRPRTFKARVASPIDATGLVVQNLLMRVPSYRYRGWLKTRGVAAGVHTADGLAANVPHRRLSDQIRLLRGATFQISSDSRFWFHALVDLARRHGCVLLAARAPLHEAFHGSRDVRPFVEQSNQFLDGFLASYTDVVQINNTNPTFTAEQGYDDKDHVASAGRAYLTHYYADRVTAFLRTRNRGSAAPP